MNVMALFLLGLFYIAGMMEKRQRKDTDNDTHAHTRSCTDSQTLKGQSFK